MGIDNLKKHIPQLKELQKANDKQRKTLLAGAKTSLLKCLCECCLNIVKGNVKINKSQCDQLSPYAKTIRALARKREPFYKRRKLLIQKGGFLPALLAPILALT